MGRFRAIWVDDDWSEIADQRNVKLLKHLLEAIMRRTRALSLEVDFLCCNTVQEAVVELQRSGSDFRLAVIDYVFRGRFQAGDLLEEIRRRCIPYILFTNYLDSSKKDAAFCGDDRFRLDELEKGDKGNEPLVDRVIAFFSAPPFRIVHLTDLHFDSSADKSVKEEQTDLFKSLVRTLESERRTRPFDAVAITGDFSASDPSKDLIEVREIVMDIVEGTVEARRIDRLFIVPGNHDIFWESFEDGIVADKPWAPFLQFFQAIYGGRIDIFNSIAAWDRQRGLFNLAARESLLQWHRKLSDPPLSVIGLITPSGLKENSGSGFFSSEQGPMFEKAWRDRPIYGEVRLALMHHNLFATLSLSRADKKSVLLNPGDAMLTLMSSFCHIALSGHTHTANAIKCTGGSLGFSGFADTGSITVVSAGTTGGVHKSRDRPRSFNILEFSDARFDKGIRQLVIRPYLYDSSQHRWNECPPYAFGSV